jgi:hypothetical protein
VGRLVRYYVGGIAGLLTLPREQWEAVEADLLSQGFTLADVPTRVTWRAIKAFVRFAPRDSAVFRLTGPASMRWTDTDYLLAVAVDLLQAMVWQRSKPGTARPKPIRRPGQIDPDRTFGAGGLMSPAEAYKWATDRRAAQLKMSLAEEVS